MMIKAKNFLPPSILKQVKETWELQNQGNRDLVSIVIHYNFIVKIKTAEEAYEETMNLISIVIHNNFIVKMKSA